MSAKLVYSAKCTPIIDNEYRNWAISMIRRARHRCLCSVFIIDLKTQCRDNDVLELVDVLQEAQWRGVDVRVLVGGSRTNFALAEAAAITRDALAIRQVPCRWLTDDEKVRGSHAKALVVDNMVLLGSHNWTPGAFTAQTQDSVAVISPGLAEYVAALFDSQWIRQGGG